MDQAAWATFQMWLTEPPPGETVDDATLEQEGAAFLSFMGAAGAAPDAGGGEVA